MKIQMNKKITKTKMMRNKARAEKVTNKTAMKNNLQIILIMKMFKLGNKINNDEYFQNNFYIFYKY